MKNRNFILLTMSYTTLLFSMVTLEAAPGEDKWWNSEVAQALERAGANRGELEKALRQAKDNERQGLAFLISNMPESDCLKLKADFLLNNLHLAYQARAEVAWGKKIPEKIFLNDVLPYANIDEERTEWRKELHDLCYPIVRGCQSPAEAAQKLNMTIYAKLKVRYSTERKKPHQSPAESIEQGKASCTGLSIILVDACRSVGIPARVVGTPMWTNMRGNHTWVEIWDGDWHFTGACEADPHGLDRGWFTHDASLAKENEPLHAIYAASFRKTKVAFPRPWAPGQTDVSAVNVTARYTQKNGKDKASCHIEVRLRDRLSHQRLARPVEIIDALDRSVTFKGISRGESADTNDILAFELSSNHEYIVRVGEPIELEKKIQTGERKSQIFDLEITADGPKSKAKEKLDQAQVQALEKSARYYFSLTPEQRLAWSSPENLDQLVQKDSAAARSITWKIYQKMAASKQLKDDFANNQVRFEKNVSTYTVKSVGKRPEAGWPLIIAMHGGGGVPKEVNDSQWQMMQIYYRDQPQVEGYKYLALRAPNDSWNGFYDSYVPPLITNLIQQFALLGDVDTNKIYLIGYSHGGYGAFYIGPKIPDRFAAIHVSAAAPTSGTISPLTLRNTRFTFMIGENDNAYGRRERCQNFAKEIAELKKSSPKDFPVEMEFKKGFGHGGLPDRDKIKELYPYTRNVVPKHLTWAMTDEVQHYFFWLSCSKPGKGKSIDANIAGNTIHITTKQVPQFNLFLDDRLIRFAEPVIIELNGVQSKVEARPSFKTLCQSMIDRNDPELAFSCQIPLSTEKK